jgi:hypothetical protein
MRQKRQTRAFIASTLCILSLYLKLMRQKASLPSFRSPLVTVYHLFSFVKASIVVLHQQSWCQTREWRKVASTLGILRLLWKLMRQKASFGSINKVDATIRCFYIWLELRSSLRLLLSLLSLNSVLCINFYEGLERSSSTKASFTLYKYLKVDIIFLCLIES